jgi:hypothetical protein
MPYLINKYKLIKVYYGKNNNRTIGKEKNY